MVRFGAHVYKHKDKRSSRGDPSDRQQKLRRDRIAGAGTGLTGTGDPIIDSDFQSSPQSKKLKWPAKAHKTATRRDIEREQKLTDRQQKLQLEGPGWKGRYVGWN